MLSPTAMGCACPWGEEVAAGVNVGDGRGEGVVVVMVVGALLLVLSSLFSASFAVGSDFGGAGASVQDVVAAVMGWGRDGIIVKVLTNVRVLLTLSSTLSSAGFVSIRLAVGSDDVDVAGVDAQAIVTVGMDVRAGAGIDVVVVMIVFVLLLLAHSSFIPSASFVSRVFDAGSATAAAAAAAVAGAIGMDVGAGVGIDVVVAVIAFALLLALSSFFPSESFISRVCNAGSDAAAGVDVHAIVIVGMDVGAGACIDVVVAMIVFVLLLLAHSSFIPSASFVSRVFDAGSAATAAATAGAIGMDVSAGAGIDVVVAVIAFALLLALSSFFPSESFISRVCDAGSDAAAGVDVQATVAVGMDLGAGAGIGVVVVMTVFALLLALSSFIPSASFVFRVFDAGSDAAAAGADVLTTLAAGINVGAGAGTHVVVVEMIVFASVLLALSSFFPSASFVSRVIDAGSNGGAAVADVQTVVAAGIHVEAGAGADVVAVMIEGVLLLALSSFFPSASFVSRDIDAGSNDGAAVADVQAVVAAGMDVEAGARVDVVAVTMEGALLLALSFSFPSPGFASRDFDVSSAAAAEDDVTGVLVTGLVSVALSA